MLPLALPGLTRLAVAGRGLNEWLGYTRRTLGLPAQLNQLKLLLTEHAALELLEPEAGVQGERGCVFGTRLHREVLRPMLCNELCHERVRDSTALIPGQDNQRVDVQADAARARRKAQGSNQALILVHATVGLARPGNVLDGSVQRREVADAKQRRFLRVRRDLDGVNRSSNRVRGLIKAQDAGHSGFGVA